MTKVEERIRKILETIRSKKGPESYAVIDNNCIEFVVDSDSSMDNEICGRDALIMLSIVLEIPIDWDLP